MSRSAVTVWTRRGRRRFSQTAAQLAASGPRFEAALAALALQLHVDPVVLLGALAADPRPAALWREIERHGRQYCGPHVSDCSELAAAADAVAATYPQSGGPFSCWVAEPADPLEAFALASRLALNDATANVTVVATHSDPLVVEIGRSGLVSDTAIRALPDSSRDAHFRNLGRCWQVAPSLRDVVHFAAAGLFDDRDGVGASARRGHDLVVSRGLLSRLCCQTSQRFALRLIRAARSGGFLLVGPGEHDLPPLVDLERRFAPGVLLLRRRRASRTAAATGTAHGDFAVLLAAIEASPTAWEPRWRLGCLLLGSGYPAPAIAHLREVARRRPERSSVWKALAQAYTLLGDVEAAEAAQRRARAPSVAKAA